MLAVALIVTARLARIEHGNMTLLVEAMGWLTALVSGLVLAAPGTIRRLILGFWDAVASDSARRAVGLFNIAFGLGIGWFAFAAF